MSVSAGQRVTAELINGAIGARAYGSFTTANIAVNGAISTPVSFPAGRFTEAPFVNITTTQGRLTFAVTNLTVAGCTIIAANWTNAQASGVTVDWQAVERVEP